MTKVVSVKFKNRGKTYYFDPGEMEIDSDLDVIVETSKGLEIARCVYGNHEVDDDSIIHPLCPVIRIATENDLRVAEINKAREKEAYEICRQKIREHGLDMKLVDVECNFEGNKTMFFFTSDGRVDFRELVKDLASVFRNRIELRQIGVRDEAKMLGGLGICGRPLCCSQFLDDFQPVSTKMAKLQSMSLNPTKISGTCGRLMCCLRYEDDSYKDLVKTVPKIGAFVETPAGYGTVTQVNLLRQIVKVKLDCEGDEVLKSYKADEIALIPEGRPKPGEEPPRLLKYQSKPAAQAEPEKTESDFWNAPIMIAAEQKEIQNRPAAEVPVKKKSSRRRGKGNRRAPDSATQGTAQAKAKPAQASAQEAKSKPVAQAQNKPQEQKNKNFAKPRNHRQKRGEKPNNTKPE